MTASPARASLSRSWATWYAAVGHALGNSWRIGPDDTNWPGVLTDIDDMAALWTYAVRG